MAGNHNSRIQQRNTVTAYPLLTFFERIQLEGPAGPNIIRPADTGTLKAIVIIIDILFYHLGGSAGCLITAVFQPIAGTERSITGDSGAAGCHRAV